MNRRAGKPTTKKTTQLVNVEEHVEGFRQVREAHRRELDGSSGVTELHGHIVLLCFPGGI